MRLGFLVGLAAAVGAVLALGATAQLNPILDSLQVDQVLDVHGVSRLGGATTRMEVDADGNADVDGTLNVDGTSTLGGITIATPTTARERGQVLILTSPTGAEWDYPFESPRVRRTVPWTSTLLENSVLVGTIRRPDSRVVSATGIITVTQTGSGSCTTAFYASSSITRRTQITSSPGTMTMTIAAGVGPSVSGSIAVGIRMGRTGSATCAIAAGEVFLSLSLMPV